MKRLILALILASAIVSCKNEPEAPAPKVTIQTDTVKEVVEYLASDELEGRNTGTDGIDKAATFIEGKFESYGVKPYFKTYRDAFNVDSLKAFNVVGFLSGNDEKLKNEVIILGAHYDHIGYTKAVKNDSIGNGANDNATGTAAVVAMAKYFAETKSNKRSILFALFSAEEMGLKGSQHLAQRLRDEKMDVYTVINFEMIGVPFTDGRDYDVLLTGYDVSNMAEKLNTYTNSKMVGESEVAIKYNLFKRSDNYPFYEKFEVPSHTISSCDLTNFDFYHHPNDEVSEIKYEFMTQLINDLIPGVEKVSQTPTKEIKLTNE